MRIRGGTGAKEAKEEQKKGGNRHKQAGKHGSGRLMGKQQCNGDIGVLNVRCNDATAVIRRGRRGRKPSSPADQEVT